MNQYFSNLSWFDKGYINNLIIKKNKGLIMEIDNLIIQHTCLSSYRVHRRSALYNTNLFSSTPLEASAFLFA